MSISVVLRKLGQAFPRQLEYGMQIHAPLKLPRRACWETQGLQPATPIFSAKFWLVKSITSQSVVKIGYAQSRMIALTLWCNSCFRF